MLFHNSLASLVVVFAAASSVTASVTPVARCGAPAPPPGQCNTGPIQCCDTHTTADDKRVGPLSAGLLQLIADAPIAAALGCTNVISGTPCNNSPVCCKDVTQNGLVNIACTPININL